MGILNTTKKAIKDAFKSEKAKAKARNVSTAELKVALKNPAKARKSGLSSATLRGFEKELERRKDKKFEKKQRRKQRNKSRSPRVKRRKNLQETAFQGGDELFDVGKNFDEAFGTSEDVRQVGFDDDFDPVGVKGEKK